MTRLIKKERILIDPSKIDKIMDSVGCHKAAVYNALAYRSNSKLAEDIRDMAINRYGGVIIKESKLVRI